MKFSEFVNKNKNVVATGTSHRIAAAIPITEERDAFFNGVLFKKYDNVKSDGKIYRILEQCSNYYQVVDEAGNISRKFAKQLTKIPRTEFFMTESMLHGYQIQTEEARNYYAHNFFVEAYDNDDVGMLKQLKEMDLNVDNYKPKDKLTVAKIIADAVGIPHDAISDPTNLVNAAIRKAKKDPVLMKNKAILQNMLQIAREVGIKYSDNTFEVKESILDEASHYFYGRSSESRFLDKAKEMHGDGVKRGQRDQHGHTSYHDKSGNEIGHHAIDGEGDHTFNLYAKKRIKESKELDENIVKTASGYRLVSKSTGKNLGDFATKEAAEKHEREVQFFKHQTESVLKPSDQAKTTLKHIKNPSLQDKYAAYDIKPGVKGYRDRIDILRDAKAKDKLKEEVEEISEDEAQQRVKNVMDRVPEHKRDAARKTYTDARKKGMMHAAALNTMAQMHMKEDVEQIEELSKTTLSNFATLARVDAVKKGNQGAKAKKPEVAYSKFKKATTRLASAAKADKKVFAKDWKERTGQNEAVEAPSAVSYKDLKAKIDNKNNNDPKSVIQKPEPATNNTLPAEHLNMATTNTARKMIVKKLSDL